MLEMLELPKEELGGILIVEIGNFGPQRLELDEFLDWAITAINNLKEE